MEGEDEVVIGPASSIAALHTQVGLAHNLNFKPDGDDTLSPETLEEKETGDVELDADSKGTPYFDGMKPVIKAKHKALANAIIDYDRIKLERCSLSTQETEAKKTMTALLKTHEADLLTDNEKDYKYYPVGDIRGVLARTEKEEVRTEHIDEEG